MATTSNQTVCIDGNLYEIVPDDSTSTGTTVGGGTIVNPYNTNEDIGSEITTTNVTLQRLVDILGGGNIPGGYVSITLTVPSQETSFEVPLGMQASQFVLNCDQDVTLTFNSSQGNNIFLNTSQFPFSVSGLKLNESVSSMFFTTGINPTNVSILAFGWVISQ